MKHLIRFPGLETITVASSTSGVAHAGCWWCRTLITSALCFLLTHSLSIASGQTSARGVAMGEAYIGLASGVDAARYNPANLGLSGYRQTGIEIVGAGANISNNSFTLSDYNRYSGAFLTDADKNDILRDVPDEGLSLIADVEASALSLSVGSFVFSTSGVGMADASLSKDIIDLILNGNTLADTVTLTGSYIDAVAYVSAGLSYGTSIYRAGARQLAVGATVKYLRGLAVEQIVEQAGMVAMFETGFEGEGRLIARTATGGSGYACDVGAALRLNDDYTAGIRVENLLSSLSWSRNTEEHGYIFSFDTMTLENMTEDYIVSDDYSKAISGFRTHLPPVMNVGFANTTGKLVWAVDWEQGFRRAAGSSSKPRVSLGLEYRLLSYLPLRTGFSTGGNRSTALSFGSGVSLAVLYFDVAVVTGTSISPYSSKGLNLALSTGIRL
ncbi:MAG TPA: DUF5723 family protein [Candidatus Deferrimicrobium sp.]|nr:DUF5723 family protein [Candidatus Deferrimicrobium sp.]